MNPEVALVAASASLLGISLAAVAALKGWQSWLDLRREQLMSGTGRPRSRSDIVELKRRVRRLEAIASGE